MTDSDIEIWTNIFADDFPDEEEGDDDYKPPEEEEEDDEEEAEDEEEGRAAAVETEEPNANGDTGDESGQGETYSDGDDVSNQLTIKQKKAMRAECGDLILDVEMTPLTAGSSQRHGIWVPQKMQSQLVTQLGQHLQLAVQLMAEGTVAACEGKHAVADEALAGGRALVGTLLRQRRLARNEARLMSEVRRNAQGLLWEEEEKGEREQEEDPGGRRRRLTRSSDLLEEWRTDSVYEIPGLGPPDVLEAKVAAAVREYLEKDSRLRPSFPMEPSYTPASCATRDVLRGSGGTVWPELLTRKQQQISHSSKVPDFSIAEDRLCCAAMHLIGEDFEGVRASTLPHRTALQIQKRWKVQRLAAIPSEPFRKYFDAEKQRVPFTPQEDMILRNAVAMHGQQWDAISALVMPCRRGQELVRRWYQLQRQQGQPPATDPKRGAAAQGMPLMNPMMHGMNMNTMMMAGMGMNPMMMGMGMGMLPMQQPYHVMQQQQHQFMMMQRQLAAMQQQPMQLTASTMSQRRRGHATTPAALPSSSRPAKSTPSHEGPADKRRRKDSVAMDEYDSGGGGADYEDMPITEHYSFDKRAFSGDDFEKDAISDDEEFENDSISSQPEEESPQATSNEPVKDVVLMTGVKGNAQFIQRDHDSFEFDYISDSAD